MGAQHPCGVIESVPPHPDSMHLQFARGWFELGLLQDAEAELARIAERYQGCMEVLEVRFQLWVRLGRFDEALVLAERQAAEFPGEYRGHMNRGNALFWLDRAEEAIACVKAVMGEHPKVAAFPYNLACYCLPAHGEDEAKRWMRVAMRVGNRAGVLRHALADGDLRAIWPWLRTMQEKGREEGLTAGSGDL